jgi:hypothetical protein
LGTNYTPRGKLSMVLLRFGRERQARESVCQEVFRDTNYSAEPALETCLRG